MRRAGVRPSRPVAEINRELKSLLAKKEELEAQLKALDREWRSACAWHVETGESMDFEVKEGP